MAARWYVIHVYSGFEKKVAQSIEEQAKQKGLAGAFEQILVPTEEVIEVKRGAKVSSERKIFPGYVLVKMDLSDESWHLVKNTPKVTGFLGGKGRPAADHRGRGDAHHEAGPGRASSGRSPRSPSRSASRSASSDGPFTSFNGFVEEVDEEKSRIKVAVSIFGRATPVELEYSQVEKM